MYFRILFDEDEFPSKLYRDYSMYLYSSIKRDIKKAINPKKYKVREPLILESSVIKWNDDSPLSIDLISYINDCLVLKEDQGVYYITFNNKRVKGSSTPVSTLIRLLEFGNEKIPPYPLIRKVLTWYQLNYKSLMLNYVSERMMGR